MGQDGPGGGEVGEHAVHDQSWWVWKSVVEDQRSLEEDPAHLQEQWMAGGRPDVTDPRGAR